MKHLTAAVYITEALFDRLKAQKTSGSGEAMGTIAARAIEKELDRLELGQRPRKAARKQSGRR